MTIETTEERMAAVLADLGTVRYISTFGRALFDRGIVKPKYKRMRQSAQGCALLAGKWLRRMERNGLAVETRDGWRATQHVQPN